ncbi:MAG: hypothetical protein AAF745_11815 [Planctomycetota bacterium]
MLGTLRVMLGALLGFSGLIASPLFGQANFESASSFVVLTRITTDQSDDAPLAEHRTVFHDDVVYDWSQTSSPFRTIVDFEKQEIVLLDCQHEIRTTLAMSSLLREASRLMAEVTDSETRTRLGMTAEVQATAKHQVRIDFPGVSYEVTTARAKHETHQRQFSRYVDWLCRLTMIRPSGLPPFARMTLNDYLAAHDLIATNTRLSVRQTDADVMVYHSQCDFQDSLDPVVQDQLQRTQAMRVTYRSVSLQEFNEATQS